MKQNEPIAELEKTVSKIGNAFCFFIPRQFVIGKVLKREKKYLVQIREINNGLCEFLTCYNIGC